MSGPSAIEALRQIRELYREVSGAQRFVPPFTVPPWLMRQLLRELAGEWEKGSALPSLFSGLQEVSVFGMDVREAPE